MYMMVRNAQLNMTYTKIIKLKVVQRLPCIHSLKLLNELSYF